MIKKRTGEQKYKQTGKNKSEWNKEKLTHVNDASNYKKIYNLESYFVQERFESFLWINWKKVTLFSNTSRYHRVKKCI